MKGYVLKKLEYNYIFLWYGSEVDLLDLGRIKIHILTGVD